MKAVTAIVLALVGLLALHSSPAAAITDVDIGNFALNLDCLEAEFYSWALTGAGLNETVLGRAPTADGGQKAELSEEVTILYTEVLNDEINHVLFWRSVLGAEAVACPQVNIGSAFSTIVATAVGADSALKTFSAYANDLNFVLASFTLGDVGVTAYEGAVSLLTNSTNIQSAARIVAVEAVHAAAARYYLFQNGALPVKPTTLQVVDVAQDISNLRASLGDGMDQGLTSPPASGIYVPYVTSYYSVLIPTTPQALAFQRTPDEVLAIVYGNALGTPGGLFPDGVNGGIQFGTPV